MNARMKMKEKLRKINESLTENEWMHKRMNENEKMKVKKRGKMNE